MDAWPSTLPSIPVMDGYSESPPVVVLRTTMDAGPAKVRRRFTSGISPINVTYQLTTDQVAIIDGFFNDTLEGGSLSFEWPHPRTGATVVARFKEPPTYSPVDTPVVWNVQIKLEVLP